MYQGNNKCLALLRHAYDEYHGFIVTVKEPNGDTYSKCYKMTEYLKACLLYTSPSPRDLYQSRMPSSA